MQETDLLFKDLKVMINTLKEDPHYIEDVKSLYWFLREQPTQLKEDYDEHRWYSIFTSVVSFQDRFFAMTDFVLKSESMELSDIDENYFADIWEVWPHTVLTVEYKRTKPNKES